MTSTLEESHWFDHRRTFFLLPHAGPNRSYAGRARLDLISAAPCSILIFRLRLSPVAAPARSSSFPLPPSNGVPLLLSSRVGVSPPSTAPSRPGSNAAGPVLHSLSVLASYLLFSAFTPNAVRYGALSSPLTLPLDSRTPWSLGVSVASLRTRPSSLSWTRKHSSKFFSLGICKCNLQSVCVKLPMRCRRGVATYSQNNTTF